MDYYGMTDAAIMREVGRRIKQYRKKNGYSQARLATNTGLSPLTIANIEQGKNTSFASLIAVMRELMILNNIDQLIPELLLSPFEILKQHKK